MKSDTKSMKANFAQAVPTRDLPPAPTKREPALTFRFIEFNPRRAERGAEAARVAVIENGEEDWLWMSKRDVAKNMMAFGRCEELVKAHEAYRAFP